MKRARYLMAHVGSTLLHSVRARGRPFLEGRTLVSTQGITANYREQGDGAIINIPDTTVSGV